MRGMFPAFGVPQTVSVATGSSASKTIAQPQLTGTVARVLSLAVSNPTPANATAQLVKVKGSTETVVYQVNCGANGFAFALPLLIVTLENEERLELRVTGAVGTIATAALAV